MLLVGGRSPLRSGHSRVASGVAGCIRDPEPGVRILWMRAAVDRPAESMAHVMPGWREGPMALMDA